MLNLRPASYLVSRWLLRRPFLEAHIPEFDLSLQVHTNDVIGRHLYKYQRYEPEVTRCLSAYVRFEPGDVVLDVGANIGWYSLVIEKITKATLDILAFEPDADNFALLAENIRRNNCRMVTPIQAAAGPDPGQQLLYRYARGNAGRHSLLPIHESTPICVETVRLDEVWQQRGLGNRVLRLIKIDVEGYEFKALQGAGQLLARCQWVLAEYSPGFMRRGGMEPADLVDLLEGHGLFPHQIGARDVQPLSRDALLALERQTNILWARKNTLLTAV
jgi:FkbM family methyltransferase